MDEVTTLTVNPQTTGNFVVENRNGEWRRNVYRIDPVTGRRGQLHSSEPIRNPLEIARLNAGASASQGFINRPLITLGGFAITPLRIGLAYAGYRGFKAVRGR